MSTRREITKKYAADYAKSSKTAKGLILDELVAVTGWSRDNARRAPSTARQRKGPQRRWCVSRGTYGCDTLKVLISPQEVPHVPGRPSSRRRTAHARPQGFRAKPVSRRGRSHNRRTRVGLGRYQHAGEDHISRVGVPQVHGVGRRCCDLRIGGNVSLEAAQDLTEKHGTGERVNVSTSSSRGSTRFLTWRRRGDRKSPRPQVVEPVVITTQASVAPETLDSAQDEIHSLHRSQQILIHRCLPRFPAVEIPLPRGFPLGRCGCLRPG
ncbi:UNVERIFIED_ORG: hypothetical protein ABID57_003312 [Arthrobacter sp. UYEF1]